MNSFSAGILILSSPCFDCVRYCMHSLVHNLTYETTRTVRANREFLPRHPSKTKHHHTQQVSQKNNSVFLIVVHFEIGSIPSSPFISFKHKMTFTKLYFCLIGGIALLQLTPNAAFTTQHVLLGTSSSHTSSPLGPLFALYSPGRSSSRWPDAFAARSPRDLEHVGC